MTQEKTINKIYYQNIFTNGQVSQIKYDLIEDAIESRRSFSSIYSYKGVNKYIVWDDGTVETHFISTIN